MKNKEVVTNNLNNLRSFSQDLRADIGMHINISNQASNYKNYNLFYRDINSEKKEPTPIVFLHNATGCSQDVLKFPFIQDRRVITYDRYIYFYCNFALL